MFSNSLISEPFNQKKLGIYNKNRQAKNILTSFAKTQQPKCKVSSVLTLFLFCMQNEE